jgi:CMP-N,N'-diacetyllegionaminic acid synthase
MRILALVPARGGSKRLPGKNIRQLAGKPLIAWTIDAASGLPDICDVLVSTDDPAIAEVARSAGAMVPWLRPAVLATDTASSVDVVLHALDWFERENGAVDGVLLLQPTSPFRARETVSRGIDLYRSHGHRPVVAVSRADSHPMWALRMEGGSLAPFMSEHGLNKRSQDLPEAYVVNGCFYLMAPDELRAHRSFFGPQTTPLFIDSPQEALDIDTEWDWRVAEAVVSPSAGNST